MARKTNGRTIGVYKAYNFTTKDPGIDELRTVVEDHFGERVSGSVMTEIKAAGGPSVAAMRGWWFAKTRRPQNATLEAAGRAMGYHRPWVKRKK